LHTTFDQYIKLFLIQAFSAVGFGRSLLHSDRITSEKSKEDLSKDLDAYSRRKEKINNKVKERTTG